MDRINVVPILIAMRDVATQGEIVKPVKEKYELVFSICHNWNVLLIACDVVSEDLVVRGEDCDEEVEDYSEIL